MRLVLENVAWGKCIYWLGRVGFWHWSGFRHVINTLFLFVLLPAREPGRTTTETRLSRIMTCLWLFGLWPHSHLKFWTIWTWLHGYMDLSIHTLTCRWHHVLLVLLLYCFTASYCLENILDLRILLSQEVIHCQNFPTASPWYRTSSSASAFRHKVLFIYPDTITTTSQAIQAKRHRRPECRTRGSYISPESKESTLFIDCFFQTCWP